MAGLAQAPFSFTDQANVFASRQVTSAPVTITGIGGSTPVTVSGGTYSIGCTGPYVSTDGIIADGQAVCIRHTSSGAPGGLAHTLFTAGAVSDTFTSITAASKASALIADYYRAILRREADPGGQGYWEGEATRMQSLGVDINETWRAMAVAFFESPEYRAFGRDDPGYVVDLYNAFLGRPPDTAGVAYWSGQIAAGMPRQAVMLSFLFSGEFATYTQVLFGNAPARGEVDMIVDFYRGLLNRLPDTAGFNYWRGRFREAQCLGRAAVLAEVESISKFFLSSAEYVARNRSNTEYLGDLYNAFLRRSGDLDGVQYWTAQLDTRAQTREQVRRAFMNSAEFQARVARVVNQPCLAPLSLSSSLFAGAVSPGVSPFIAFIDLQGNSLDRISAVRFTIVPRPGSASRPLSALYSTAYLARSGYLSLPLGPYRVPVFGLYAGHANVVNLEIRFDDGSIKLLAVPVLTATYSDPAQIYDRPNILTRRAPGSLLGFDFMYLKTGASSPVVIDTDGDIRWIMPYSGSSASSLFDGSGFVVGDWDSLELARLGLDGSVRAYSLQAPYAYFHHNMEPGKFGILGEVDEVIGDVINYENILVEFNGQGEVIKQWNLGALLSAYMTSRGDDPSSFIRLGVDWFHMNSAIYDPGDNSLILSSRENFVIKIDYETGAPVWILGDPAKYWYTFASLRAISLVVPDGGLYPIGQHALYKLDDGRLLLFNNGMPSFNQPNGMPAGELRPYSAVSAYTIDPVARTARETYRFDYGRTIFSNFCSSAYPEQDSMLVTYSFADAGNKVRLVGLGSTAAVVFDFEYPSVFCVTAWNAEPIEFHDLTLN